MWISMADQSASMALPAEGGKKLRRKKKKTGSGDYFFTLLVLTLTVIGIIMVFSASYYYALNTNGTPYYYLIRQVVFACIGLVFMLFFAWFDYHWLATRLSWGIIIGAGILVGLTYTPLGVEINNATRWIGFGGFTILPGEWAKLAVIIFVAAWFANRPERRDYPLNGILPVLMNVGVVAAIVYFQPSTSTAVTILIILLGMFFAGNVKLRYIFAIVAVGASAVVIHILSGSGGESGGDYRLTRVLNFLDPFKDQQGAGYQVVQGLYALALGGLRGVGLGNSVQKALYLPDPQNDFILAVIGEEVGFLGIIILLVLFLLLIWRCVRIAFRAPDELGFLLASGITVMIGIQVVLNALVVSSSMPATGIALPFISYGGTAIMQFMSAAGIMINISRHGARKRLTKSKLPMPRLTKAKE